MRHDFRNKSWGHNIDAKMNVLDHLEGFSWSTPALRLGDEIVWETNYGWAVGKIIAIKPYMDPSDMTKFSAEITERYVSEEVKRQVLSGEVDRPPWPVINL